MGDPALAYYLARGLVSSHSLCLHAVLSPPRVFLSTLFIYFLCERSFCPSYAVWLSHHLPLRGFVFFKFVGCGLYPFLQPFKVVFWTTKVNNIVATAALLHSTPNTLSFMSAWTSASMNLLSLFAFSLCFLLVPLRFSFLELWGTVSSLFQTEYRYARHSQA